MPDQSPFQEIPIIDLAPLVADDATLADKQHTANEIGAACRDVGFFYVKNHGVPREHLESVFPQVRRFFELPLEEKLKIHIGRSKIYRGYTPMAEELTNGLKDLHEAVDFGKELSEDHPDVQANIPMQGPNQWPEGLPEFKTMLLRHWDHMTRLGGKITEGLALSLGYEPDFFVPHNNKAQNSMRILAYPPEDPQMQDESMGDGIGAHTDYGFLTMLLQDEVAGLEVQNTANEWIPAPIIPGTLVINIGHMTERWTNDHYKATVHRVLAPKQGNRYSLPYFFEPNFDTVVAPLERCCTPEKPPRYEPLHFGKFFTAKFETSYAEAMN